MSTNVRGPLLATLLVLAAGLLWAGQTPHATPKFAPAQGGEMSGGPHAGGSPDAQLQMLAEKLNLTDDQKTKLKPILQDEAQQMKAVHEDASLSPDQKHAKMKSIHESFRGQINGVLTPEQQAKWKQMKQEAMEKHKGMKEGEMDQH